MVINIGYKNFLKLDIIAAILKPVSLHVKKLRQYADDKGLLINSTSGHKTRSVIILTTAQVILSSLQTTTFKARADTLKPSLINIGYENFINYDLFTSIHQADSAHTKKIRMDAAERGQLINATCGHKTRSVIVMQSGQVVLSSIRTTTFEAREKELRRKQLDSENDEPF